MLQEHRTLLEPLIAAFIREHDNDPKQCLAALSSITSIKKELDGLKDPDVTLTLCEIQDVSTPISAVP
jgi:hypothetical protein